jgi:hypothetical protein
VADRDHRRPWRPFDSSNGTDVTYALYRKVIEIRDAQMALRAICQIDIDDWARSAARRYGILPGSDTALVVEAAQLAAALRARQVRNSYSLDLTQTGILAAHITMRPPAGIATRTLGDTVTTSAFPRHNRPQQGPTKPQRHDAQRVRRGALAHQALPRTQRQPRRRGTPR